MPDTITASKFDGKKWIKQPNNRRKIIIRDNFKQDKMMHDFYKAIENYILVIPQS